MAETRRLRASRRPPPAPRVTTHVADVSDEAQVLRFRDAVAAEHATDKLHLLFNNAGIGGGGSLFANSRDAVGADLQHLLGRRLSLRRARSCRCW